MDLLGAFWGIWSNISLTSVLGTVAAVLLGYYLWPLINQKLSHIPGPAPWPIFGNFLQYMKHGFCKTDLAMLKKYGKVYRVYEGRRPTLVISDTEILKQLLVKDFSDFSNRRVIPLRGVLKNGLFDSVDHQWRRLRHILSPSYTSGKLKKMTAAVQDCVDKLVRNIGEKSLDEFEAKEISGMFTLDVIAGTGFGLDLDSQKDANNPFLVNAKAVTDFNLANVVLILIFFFPFLIPLLHLFGVELGNKKPMKFFETFLLKTIEERKTSNANHHDLLQLMLDASQHEEEIDTEDDQKINDLQLSKADRSLSSTEIHAQAVLFFLAAYETTSSTMAFLMYELSKHQQIQETLHAEITNVMKSYDDVNYEAVSKMEYLDQCIQETLRMYPPAVRIDRRSTRDVTINGVFIPEDTICNIPIYALHNDPDVWPQPETFDPERFTAEAKQARGQFNHLPFGLGPRQCIGMRLAMMEMKMAFVKLLSSYRLIPSDKKTELDYSMAIRAKNGIWLKTEPRE